ncbi:MAG TPA: kelch repeat-containing protein [Steroidobacteraceae bacterium]
MLTGASCHHHSSSTASVATYTLGGTIVGLTAGGLVLSYGNGSVAALQTVSPASGATSFVFPTAIANDTDYFISVQTEPTGLSCAVSFGAGIINSADVTSVVISCSLPWVWQSGEPIADAVGVYGTKGVATATNIPGGRAGAASWIDQSGNFWIFGGSGFDATGSLVDFNDLWEYSPTTLQWTWVSGTSTSNAAGVYGTLGVAAAGNFPGARVGATSWIDKAGNFWLFGGALNNAATGVASPFNDLWKFTPGTGLWTWVSGSNVQNGSGSYGTKGTAAPTNTPGARNGGGSWVDATGNFWLFGGAGYDAVGTLGDMNDLWEFSPSTGQWSWMSGSSTANAIGVYGTQGTPAAGNVPGGRVGSVSWLDPAGNFWVFGGEGLSSADVPGNLDDMWEYSLGSGQWTWMAGFNAINLAGVYGTEGIAAAGNVPGARAAGVSWTDLAGNLWLFGGGGYSGTASNVGYLNDLWKFTPSTGQWTWISGDNVANAIGVYSKIGAATGSLPGARDYAAAWIDASGNLWMFGGQGYDLDANLGELNDLWEFPL